MLGSLISRFAPRRSRPLGTWGERLAEEFLVASGYQILERNYRVRGGEADLVARHGDSIVVVEVKTRASRRFGAPNQAVTTAKSRRVYRAGCAYCRARGHSLSQLRCDVITVDCTEGTGEPRLRHYPAGIVLPDGRR
jgi:putative endonuclease